jgi:hypothetical protein
MAHVDVEELVAALDRGFKWVRSNLLQFSLSNAKSEEEKLQLLKPLGELALAADLIEQLIPGRFLTKEISEWCWNELEQGETLVGILSVRPDLIVIATLYANFKRAGLHNSRLDLLIAFLSKSPSVQNIELPTWRRLDVEHGLASLGLSLFPSDPEKGTWLSALPEPWTITDDIAYAMTHDVFYITDFGHEQDRLSADSKRYLRTWLPTWLTLYQKQMNWDLFAELLIVAACIDSSLIGMTAELGYLISVQHENGMVRGPPNSAKNLLSDTHTEHRTVFLKNYHTTLVSLIAFAFGTRRTLSEDAIRLTHVPA